MTRHMAPDDDETFRIVLEYQFRKPNPAWLHHIDQPGVPEYLDELSDVAREVRGPYRTVGAARSQRRKQLAEVIGTGTYYAKARVFVRQYVERAQTTWKEVAE